jgi:predicted Co/Zn/Cd cation transporter (cation efflux family)
MNYQKLCKILLYLIAFHSFTVGLLLIILPGDLIAAFGFNLVEKNFFQIQGGVFHLVVCFAYISAAIDLFKNNLMIYFAIFTKISAFIFLLSYFLLVQEIMMVLLSGIGDVLMGLMLLFLFRKIKSENNS